MTEPAPTERRKTRRGHRGRGRRKSGSAELEPPRNPDRWTMSQPVPPPRRDLVKPLPPVQVFADKPRLINKPPSPSLQIPPAQVFADKPRLINELLRPDQLSQSCYAVELSAAQLSLARDLLCVKPYSLEGLSWYNMTLLD